MWRTDLWGTLCETGAIVCVHDDASSWWMFVGSRGQCLSFCAAVRILSFSLWHSAVAAAPLIPLSFTVSSSPSTVVPLQSSWRSLLVSAHNSSPCQVHAISVLHLLCPVCHSFSGGSAQFEARLNSRSLYSACEFFFPPLYTTPDQSSLR